MITKSESIKNISGALLLFHNNMGKVVKSETNPFFKSKYADLSTILAAIKGPLDAAGLAFSQMPSGIHELTTILMHPASGEYLESTYTMTPSKNDPQGLGSAITYQRRYALGAVLGLNIDEDDDGNAASKPTSSVSKPKPLSGSITKPTTPSAVATKPSAEVKHLVCPVHGDTVIWHEAGVTKTGKAYPGFWSCSEKDENNKFCKVKPVEAPEAPRTDLDKPPFGDEDDDTIELGFDTPDMPD